MSNQIDMDNQMDNQLVGQFGDYLAGVYFHQWTTSNSELSIAQFCAYERATWNTDGDGRGVALGCVAQITKLNSGDTVEFSYLQL